MESRPCLRLSNIKQQFDSLNNDNNWYESKIKTFRTCEACSIILKDKMTSDDWPYNWALIGDHEDEYGFCECCDSNSSKIRCNFCNVSVCPMFYHKVEVARKLPKVIQRELITAVHYRPLGAGFIEAKNDFNNHLNFYIKVGKDPTQSF